MIKELILKDATGKEISFRVADGGFYVRLPHKDGFTNAYLTKEHARSLVTWLQEQTQ